MDETKGNETVLLLPQLKADCDVKGSEKAGEWQEHSSKAFNDVATSLEYSAPGAVTKISSVPTMWARPLTLEMVLYDEKNPLRTEMAEQWQGMLAAIALAEHRGFPLTVKLIELYGRELKGEYFADSLRRLLPDYQGRNLYTLEDRENKNPWQDVYVFLWKQKAVGMTSPSTIVVPSEQGKWTGLPWWNEQEGRLKSPQMHLSDSEKGLLWAWLRNLIIELDQHNGDRNALNTIKGLIGGFQASLGKSDIQLSVSDEPEFFGVPINRGALIGLNSPIKAPEQPSSVQLIPSRNKAGKKKPLLIYDPEIARIWNVNPQSISIYGGKTLASFKPEEFRDLQERWNSNVVLLSKDELFLSELYFIELEDALPGGLLPKNDEAIKFNNLPVTPLISLNSILLDYFTPEDLVSKIKFQPLKTSEGVKVRLILDLPLSGVKADKPSENYRLYKDYDLKEENALGTDLPILHVWPNFQATGWKEYYVFYYDGDLGEKAIRVGVPQEKYRHRFPEEQWHYQISQLESFPEYVQCSNVEEEQIGLILFKPPTPVQLTGKWHVGVDFGTSFTNIYFNEKEIPEQLKLENLQLQVTETPFDTRYNVLFEHFIPEDFIPSERPLPLSSVLTIKGQNSRNEKMLPLSDGRIYVPDSRTFEPNETWMKTNLKWSIENRPFNALFLKHLALHITALAAKKGVKEIQWSLSYPSAYSGKDVKDYATVWHDAIVELQKTTGITQNLPEIGSSNLRTESLAVAQYFADFERHDLVYTTCIDMGGGTSDISVWENNELIHQCSVLLAGRDIFSYFLELNPKFLEERFKVNNPQRWKNLRGGAFNAKLDVWLRLESEAWLKNQRPLLQEEKDFQGLLKLTAIGIAGLYYYVGIILKVLQQEGKYSRENITPVYLGGNASRFLNWLDSTGRFNPQNSQIKELLSRMLSAGSGFPDTEQSTQLSKNAKHEAACGLVLKDTKLKGLGKKVKDPLIAGEACTVKIVSQAEEHQETRLTFLAGSRIEVDRDFDIKEFKISELVEVPKFLYEFHQALRDLDIEEIEPLKGYVRSPEREKNSKLWEETQRELDNLLLDINGQSADNIRFEPPFILGLKALLRALGKRWTIG